MRESVRPHHPLTVEEYLALEETATVKHEYVAGNVYAMVGATKRHNRIGGNIYRRLADAAEGGPCQVYMEAVKLRVASDLIYYPDVMVACEPDDDPLIENTPCLVVEVTSPNTEMTDRREKLVAYRQIPSLEAYLIVSQDRRWVEHHFRDESGKWQRSDLLEEGRIMVPCPSGAQLTLDDIYRGIEAIP
jgi:Uma2 family endonuclease